MEDVVDRAFDLQLRQGLLKGVNLTHEQIPMFDFQDERELENKKEKIKQYYTNWLQRKMIDEIIDFTEKFYDGNHNPLSTKTRLTEIFAKYGYDVK
jgi:hypothetical protein